MPIDKHCKVCNREMKVVKEGRIANTTYQYLICEQCKKEVARRVD